MATRGAVAGPTKKAGTGVKASVTWAEGTGGGGPACKEGVVHKMEKGLVGVKWTRKWARADALHMAYFASLKPNPSDPPRKVFTLDDCSVGKTSIALISKFKIKQPHSFMIENKQTGYVAVFATESEAENESWINFLRQPAPDKRNSHLSGEIEMSLRALDLPHDSPEFSNTVFHLLCNENDSVNLKYLKALLAHLGKISSDAVVEAVSRDLDPHQTGYVTHAVFQQWWESGGPSRVPDLQNSPSSHPESSGTNEAAVIFDMQTSEFSCDSHIEHKNDFGDENEMKINERNTSPEETESKTEVQSATKMNKEFDVGGEGDEQVSSDHLHNGPREIIYEDPENGVSAPHPQSSISLDTLVPGMASRGLDAQVVPSTGPDIGGQAVSIMAQGLNRYRIKSVMVCGVPATVDRHTPRTLHVTTNPKSRSSSSKEADDGNGDILITTDAGLVFVFRSCYRYMDTVEFFATLRTDQGYGAAKSGYVITDFGPVVKGSDGYGVSLAFDSIGISALKHWHKRWFEVSHGVFRHARSPTDPFEEILPLTPEISVELVARARVGRPHVVRIEGSGKNLLLQATSDDDQLEWAAVIKQSVLPAENTISVSSKNVLVEIQDSSKTRGHRQSEYMTPLEMLAQEYGIVQQMQNQKKGRPSLALTQEYHVVRDSMISQQSSNVVTLSPNSMTIVQGLRAVPARSRETQLQESVNLSSQQFLSRPRPQQPLSEISNAVQKEPRDNQGLIGFLKSMDIDTESPTSVIHIFDREQVDLSALRLMTEQDLKDLTVPAGPRKKIVHALQLISGTDPTPTPTVKLAAATRAHTSSPTQNAPSSFLPNDAPQTITLEPSQTTEINSFSPIPTAEETSPKPQLFAAKQDTNTSGAVKSSQAALSFAKPALRQKKKFPSSSSTTDRSRSAAAASSPPKVDQPETTSLSVKRSDSVSSSKTGISALAATSPPKASQSQTTKTGIAALIAASLAKAGPPETRRLTRKEDPRPDMSVSGSVAASLSKPSKPKTRKPSRQAA